ncbi:MAG: N-6 DNA methylase [Prolixibacteraceae bacterium]|nr:N-6 DNA methylase [Prolixibacteraceae bacterium]
MLDTPTKKRIDDCRDILVGKLPDPKAQIEQITIGLIYKFMDDMDKEAIELGGKAKFFSNYTIPDPNDAEKEIVVEFEKYSWDRLFDAKVTASEMLTLYAEAIGGMDKNPNIPQLFRDIFKNAFLPYRDPETLKMFLKTIAEFEYTHSEKLGDAFEYLLSVMGSQGDAGQFRTPRHIIDFLVAVVNPGKTDTILDPACGTAGFLISAFKYIMGGDNNGHDGRDARSGVSTATTITPDERRRIIGNFTGYDISPDMVRLSLVNLYLHGFSDPHIWEYDTLSSEERWDETFDVILANPPFMSPKGGIRPHKKFSIGSNRSEVLFVDYIAEHLNPKGRAGIIVPEGVIFQSGTAYKALRKMLVDNYLYAVVSLPAGIFNPYSGVKTSILLMDKQLAKQTDQILFVKIDNDGYGLGAQRNAVKGGQLDEAIEIIRRFVAENTVDTQCIAYLPTNTPPPANPIAHAVPKAEIAKNGDYNLSGERYKATNILSTNYESVKLGDVCRVINGRAYKQEELLDAGKYPVMRVGNFFSNRDWYHSNLELEPDKYCLKGDLLYAWSASFGPKIWDGEKCIYHYHIWKMEPDESRINKQFLYHVLNKETEAIKAEGGRGIAMIHITKSGIEQREIPLPPLSVQQEIVAEIEGYQAEIENYKLKIKEKEEAIKSRISKIWGGENDEK